MLWIFAAIQCERRFKFCKNSLQIDAAFAQGNCSSNNLFFINVFINIQFLSGGNNDTRLVTNNIEFSGTTAQNQLVQNISQKMHQ